MKGLQKLSLPTLMTFFKAEKWILVLLLILAYLDVTPTWKVRAKSISWIKVYWQRAKPWPQKSVSAVGAGAQGGRGPYFIRLVNPFQTRGNNMPIHITTCPLPPRFSDLPTALNRTNKNEKKLKKSPEGLGFSPKDFWYSMRTNLLNWCNFVCFTPFWW